MMLIGISAIMSMVWVVALHAKLSPVFARIAARQGK